MRGQADGVCRTLGYVPTRKTDCRFLYRYNDINELTDIRRAALSEFKNLPISGEYIHRHAFDIAAVYGKDTFYIIKTFGTHQLPKLFDLKARVDRFSKKISFLPKHFSDKFMQLISKILPDHLPKSMRNYRDKYEHHLI